MTRSLHPAPGAPMRDERIDFWRGLCLIDMFVVHLVYQGMLFGEELGLLLGEYTRFAAGGFVFIAGLSVGAILLPKAMRDEASRRRVYRSLWRRAGLLVVVHYLLEFGCLLLYPRLVGMPVDSYAGAAWEILVFRRGSGLLMFYVAMLLIAPLLIEAMRRGLGPAVLTASVVLFAWGRMGDNAWRVALPVHREFLVVLWQVIFVAGLFAGRLLPRFDAVRTRTKAAAMGAALAVLGVLWANCYAPDFGRQPWLPLMFGKTPLATGEVLKYIAAIVVIMLASDLGWSRLRGTGFSAAVARLGRNSLLVYVAHVWVVILMVRLSWSLGWAGPSNLLVAALGLALLWAVARQAEEPLEASAARRLVGRLAERLAPHGVPRPRVRPAFAWSAGVGLIVAMVAVDAAFRATAPTVELASAAEITLDGAVDYGAAAPVLFADEPADAAEAVESLIEDVPGDAPDEPVEAGDAADPAQVT